MPEQRAERAGANRGDGGAEARPIRRNLVGVMLAAAVLVGVTMAAATGDDQLEPDPLTEDPAGVELPDPEVIDEGAGDRAPKGPEASAGEAETPCEPDGCALWTISRPPGRTVIAGSMLVTSVRGGHPQRIEEREARLQGLSLGGDGLPVRETEVGLPLGDSGGVGVLPG